MLTPFRGEGVTSVRYSVCKESIGIYHVRRVATKYVPVDVSKNASSATSFLFYIIFINTRTFQLNSWEVLPLDHVATFWTSRGHKSLPFSPRVCVHFHRAVCTYQVQYVRGADTAAFYFACRHATVTAILPNIVPGIGQCSMSVRP